MPQRDWLKKPITNSTAKIDLKTFKQTKQRVIQDFLSDIRILPALRLNVKQKISLNTVRVIWLYASVRNASSHSHSPSFLIEQKIFYTFSIISNCKSYSRCIFVDVPFIDVIDAKYTRHLITCLIANCYLIHCDTRLSVMHFTPLQLLLSMHDQFE